MAYQYTGLNVGVRDRVLWVGSHAYPLHNLSRVYPRSLTVDTRRRALRAAGWQCLLIFVVLMILEAAAPNVIVGLVLFLLGAALIAYRIVYAVQHSAPVVLNQLVIETTGGQGIVLDGRDQYQLLELQARIAESINNPDANFFLTVYAQVGDNITQNGNHNVGKAGW